MGVPIIYLPVSCRYAGSSYALSIVLVLGGHPGSWSVVKRFPRPRASAVADHHSDRSKCSDTSELPSIELKEHGAIVLILPTSRITRDDHRKDKPNESGPPFASVGRCVLWRDKFEP